MFWIEKHYRVVQALGHYVQSSAFGWFLAFCIVGTAWLIVQITVVFLVATIRHTGNVFYGKDKGNILKFFSNITADVAVYITSVFFIVQLIPLVGSFVDLIRIGLSMISVVVLFEPNSLLLSGIAVPSGGYDSVLIIKIAAWAYLLVPMFIFIRAKFEYGVKEHVSFAAAAIILLFMADALIAFGVASGAIGKMPFIAPRIYGLITTTYFFFARLFPMGVAGGITFFIMVILLATLPNGLIHYFFTGKTMDKKLPKPSHVWRTVFLTLVLLSLILYLTFWPWSDQVSRWLGMEDQFGRQMVYYFGAFCTALLTAWLLLAISSTFGQPILQRLLRHRNAKV